jgi:hypothetical protein
MALGDESGPLVESKDESFHNFFYFTTVLGSESELLSDSDPAKTFGFFRIWIHNTP